MKGTKEILFSYTLYHEWVDCELIKIVEKSSWLAEEIISHFKEELAAHNFWLNILLERKTEKKYGTTISEIADQYSLCHGLWQNFVADLKKEDFSRLIKFSNSSGLVKTHSLIDLIMESFRIIENHQHSTVIVLETTLRKKIRLGFLDYRQKLNSL